ncbi:hypothetical protein K435DRAFT_861234 [Dendrothele bispora CBS 962.96]|uniref:Uncharacterized protein n=1 Tax=Dendrothele bispora (strain CBS 962.96) TaxID=1314807 RepID=A0A4S8LVW7_DENBC|nr:hypothetical protein K435DRAFT_861234 [Dendrothele bispora CBS 962.96]
MLTGNSLHGSRSTPFSDDLSALRQCAANHGIDLHGILQSTDLRSAILHHIFMGGCFMGQSEDVMQVLNMDYDETESLKDLRKRLRTEIRSLRQKNHRAEADTAALEARVEEIRARWPELIPSTLKDEFLSNFLDMTSSDALATYICASCSEEKLRRECVTLPLADVNLDLFKRPDVRVERNGTVADSEWREKVTFDDKYMFTLKDHPDILLDRQGIIEIEEGAVQLQSAVRGLVIIFAFSRTMLDLGDTSTTSSSSTSPSAMKLKWAIAARGRYEVLYLSIELGITPGLYLLLLKGITFICFRFRLAPPRITD